jgi:hypothetical protein
MIYCENACLDMPAAFPCHEYTLWRTAAGQLVAASPHGDPAWEHLGASNLTAWRFRQAWENWDWLKAFAEHTPDGGNHEDHCVTDDRMFSMLTAISSCIESTVYSISALASLPSIVGFPFATQSVQRNGSSPTWLLDKIAQHPKAGLLSHELTALVASPQWLFFMDLRNRVSHRSNLSKPGFATMGGTLPAPIDFHYSATTSTPEVALTIAQFEGDLAWLAGTLQRILTAARALII